MRSVAEEPLNPWDWGARVLEVDVHAGAFMDALLRAGHTELAEDFATWWYDNRPDDDEE